MALRPRTLIARRLRRGATTAEKQLWRALRTQYPLWKFRRQHPIGRRIVDFACPAGKLAIELDGAQHAKQQEEDAARSAELAASGYRVIRFWNNEVVENVAGVLQVIMMVLEEGRPTSPIPSAPDGAKGDNASGESDGCMPRGPVPTMTGEHKGEVKP
jgi:very-short-patch-repair endonuclease